MDRIASAHSSKGSLTAARTRLICISVCAGTPEVRSLPYTLFASSVPSSNTANSFLRRSAVLFPIRNSRFLLTRPAIAASSVSPPVFSSRFMTIPPRESTDNSVVPPPKLAIKIPVSFITSSPSPTASASPRSTILTDFAFASECITRS